MGLIERRQKEADELLVRYKEHLSKYYDEIYYHDQQWEEEPIPCGIVSKIFITLSMPVMMVFTIMKVVVSEISTIPFYLWIELRSDWASYLRLMRGNGARK